MKCSEAQNILSLYLYGELEFAQEEILEHHLADCAFCRLALDREKAWHTNINSGVSDMPFELLAECRDDLRRTLKEQTQAGASQGWTRYFSFLNLNRWSLQLAIGSALVFVGFACARWADRHVFPEANGSGSLMSLVQPSVSRIREVQANGPNSVRIVVEQVGEQQITGSPDDANIRKLLLAGTADPLDPGVRIDSVDWLKDQPGNDVKQALLKSARNDSNAAVRLKALAALQRFSSDAATQETLKYVLQHDDNAGVRSEAIDLLVPAGRKPVMSPDTLATVQTVLRSGQQDEYVRARCLQVLRDVSVDPSDLY